MTRRPHQAFTIIEMLVIISIIVLLVAILVPALAGARRNAQKSVCLSNLNAMGQAMNVYLENSPNRTFPGSFGPGVLPNAYSIAGEIPGDVSSREGRPLNKYLSNAVEAARCPLDEGADNVSSGPAWATYGTSYIYFDRDQGEYQSGVWVVEGRRWTQIKWPSQKMTIADLIIDRNRDGQHIRNQWHNGTDPLQINMLFADGHAEPKTRKINPEWSQTGDVLLQSEKGYY